jgi:uncharacterized protein
VTEPTRRGPRSLPTPVGITAEWYGYLARAELRFQRCEGCDAWRHPPRHLCPSCGSDSWRWEPAAGRGEVFSWTVTHQALHPGFADALPYAVLVVELEEGVRVVCGTRTVANEKLALGLPVTIDIEPVNDEIGLLYARLV